MPTLLFSDIDLLRLFCGSGSVLIDQLVVAFTTGWTWVPLYVALVYMVIRGSDSMAQICLTVGLAAFCVLTTALLADAVVKPLVARPRPCYDPRVSFLLDLVPDYVARGFSFPSAHAANTMALAVFVSRLAGSRRLTIVLIGWSLANCWTRLYLGVHYPSDILCGLLIGIADGWLFHWLYTRLYRKTLVPEPRGADRYTPKVYAERDVDIVICVLMLTLCYVLGRGWWTLKVFYNF